MALTLEMVILVFVLGTSTLPSGLIGSYQLFVSLNTETPGRLFTGDRHAFHVDAGMPSVLDSVNVES